MLELLAQSLFAGVLAGGAYALIALGLALVFGTMRVINLAHGELVLLAAYIAYTVEAGLHWPVLAAIPLALAIVCMAATATYALVSRIREDRELNSLLLTFGLGVILTNVVLLIWKADIRTTSSAWLQDAMQLGPLYAMRGELLFFAIALALLAAVWWWLTKSWHGRAVRAVASNRDAAELMGIDPRRTEFISFLLAGAMATFAGVALYCTSVVQPALGASLTVKAFVITVLAGLGSISGVLIGAVLLGIAEALTITLASSALQELAGMVLFLVVLLVLPNGLFGARLRRG